MYAVRGSAYAVLVALFCLGFKLSVEGQQQTPQEMSREAGRIATQAGRIQGEAYKKIQAGTDRKLVREAERNAAERFEKAIELWRAAGDERRLIAGVDELTRLYSVLGDYDRVVDRLTREADFWRERGDSTQRIETLFLLGIRQMQMERNTAATETLERVAEMSREKGLHSLEANVFNQLSFLYDRTGRAKEAETARDKARELWKLPTPQRPAPAPLSKPAPATIPAQWVDLPSAPLGAEYRDIDGMNHAVLANRSSKLISGVMYGCVALEENGKAKVLYGLIGFGMSHGGIEPGSYFTPFAALNGPLNRWTDEKMGCEGAAKMTVIEATFEHQTKWNADGAEWIVR